MSFLSKTHATDKKNCFNMWLKYPMHLKSCNIFVHISRTSNFQHEQRRSPEHYNIINTKHSGVWQQIQVRY